MATSDHGEIEEPSSHQAAERVILQSLDDTTHDQAARKKRNADSRMSYPRKRAITACQLCRMRKTKCDNQRPSCGSCLALDIHCNYQDRGSTDHSSFDSASLAILDRLNTAIQLLQKQAHLPALIESLSASQASLQRPLVQDSPYGTTISPDQRMSLSSAVFDSPYSAQEGSNLLDDVLQGPCNYHDVLVWPVFQSQSLSHDLVDAFYNQDDESQIRERNSGGHKGIREEDAPVLVEHFLQQVHIKNPILDAKDLTSSVRRIAEEGFRWDGKSCLMLVICALACLAVPFSFDRPSPDESSIADAKDYPTAEAYYVAARKRIGLLDNSILSIQCVFLLGVYQMYSLRPLKAWMSFNNACAMFQIHLHTRSYHELERATKRLEQRLYWSCLKSECEMREQVELPPSGLAKVNYPDLFPSPPGGTPEPETSSEVPQGLDARGRVDHEKSWYYYLSEIAFRQLRNRISTVLHSGSPSSWQPASLPRLTRLAEELDSQVQKWAEHIPGFATAMSEPGTDELTHILQARYWDLQELICRPFLYFVLHSERPNTCTPTTMAYAERSISLQIKTIQLCTLKHRHHGAWFTGRQCFRFSMMLLAAVQSQRLVVSGEWEATVQQTLTLLSYYSAEAPDLGAARNMLSNFQASVTSSRTYLD